MKLNEDTLDILKNFVCINKGIVLHPGNDILTKSFPTEMYARATVTNNFDTRVEIGDLSQFLQLVSSYDDNPDIDFRERSLVISPDKDQSFVPYGTGVQTPDPNRRASVSKPDLVFPILKDQFVRFLKRTGIRGFPHVAFVWEDNTLNFRGSNCKDPSAGFVDINMVTSDQTTQLINDDPFSLVFNYYNIQRIKPQDYMVSISKTGIAEFKSANLTYYALTVDKLSS